MSVHIPQSFRGMPSTLIVPAAAGEVSTRSEPRRVKLPVSVVVIPDVIVTVWGAGSVKPCTWLKLTVYVPGDSSSQFRPHESAMYGLPAGLIVICDGSAGEVTARRNPNPLCPTAL